ncbi:hypothetical protein Scep_011797 [Stephania cephalantha]|uniref:Fe2OG dioxygenase domain-containing protein n=1 Tax=Stephania cephalantha TaxID=152367 RepID=A0AAP0JE01_9MAGN
MENPGIHLVFNKMTVEYDRAQEVKAFDDTKAGVRGLVEDGITKLPQIFVTPPDRINEKKRSGECKDFDVPIIDLEVIICDMGREAGRERKEIINQVKDAAETWGFFQVVNHGIPMEVLDEMLKAVRMFHEQPKEERSKFYSRDVMRKVRYNCNFDLYNSEAANWRDTVGCIVDPGPLNQEELPLAFRNILMNYSKHASKLGNALFKLLSEALGLGPSHLHDMGCSEGHLILGHYYPPCPEPQKTLGCSKHSDKDFLTILLQDQTGGLQVLHQGEWIDIIPVHGGLVINIGDLLQAKVKALDDTKAGVKGLVEAGITKVPRIFVTPPDRIDDKMSSSGQVKAFNDTKAGVKRTSRGGITKVPRIFVTPPDRIDDKMSSSGRKDVVEVPIIDLEGIYDVGRDDTVGCIVAPEAINQEELPVAFISSWTQSGPSTRHMGCLEGHLVLGHYYPPCPEPDKTLGFSKHSDNDFLTILFQDQGIGTRSIPSPRSQCIFDSLSEVFEILYCIDQGIPSVNRESRAAKAMWTGETFNAIFQETKSQVVNAIQMPQEQAIEIIKSVKGNLSNFGYYSISQELNMIIRFIRQRANRSMEEIHRDLEQLFVDMLNERLVQPPGIIVKEINESPRGNWRRDSRKQ